jgi:hypothetical protein
MNFYYCGGGGGKKTNISILKNINKAPYFKGKPKYPNGGYVTVNDEVGDLIDWYNVQFYN